MGNKVHSAAIKIITSFSTFLIKNKLTNSQMVILVILYLTYLSWLLITIIADSIRYLFTLGSTSLSFSTMIRGILWCYFIFDAQSRSIKLIIISNNLLVHSLRSTRQLGQLVLLVSHGTMQLSWNICLHFKRRMTYPLTNRHWHMLHSLLVCPTFIFLISFKFSPIPNSCSSTLSC